MATEKLLFQVELDDRGAETRANKLAQSIAKDRAEVQKLTKAIKESNQQDKQAIAEKNRLTNQIQNNSKELRLNNNVLKATGGSLGGLRQQEKLLRAELDKVDQSTKKGRISAQKLSKEILTLKNSIKEADESTGDFSGNVGNYTASIQQAIPLTGSMGVAMTGLSSAARIGAASFALVTKSITGTNSALRVFKIVLAGTGIGAIVLALGSLVTFLTSTQRGMDLVTRVTRPLTAIFQRLLGVIQVLGEDVFGGLAEAVKSPKQALQDLGDFIIDQVLNRFRAIGVAFEGITQLLEGNFSQGFKTLADAGIQAVTGITDATDKLNAAFETTQEFFRESTDAGLRIDKLNKQIEQGEISLIKRRSELNLISRANKLVVDDVTKSEQARIKAANDGIAAQSELAKLETQQLDLRIALKKEENALNDTSREDLKELAELEAERNDKVAGTLRLQGTLTVALNSIEKQVAAQREKDRKAEAAARVKALEDELAALEIIALAQAENTQARVDIEQEILAKSAEIALQNEQLTANQRLLIEAQLIADQQALQTDHIQFLNDQEVKADAEHQKLLDKALEDDRRRFAAERALQDARLGFFTELTQALVDNTKQQTIAGKAAIALQKAAASAEVAVNLQRELQGISASNSIFPEPFGSIIKTTQRVLAGIRAAKSIATIAGIKFAEGGELALSGGSMPASGGMITGKSHGQGGVKFAMGNSIGEADGRKGEAYIVNTANRPELKSLASQINVAGGGRAFSPSVNRKSFAFGGVASVAANEVAASNEATQNLVDVIASMPNPVVGVEQFTDAQNRVDVIESSAILE